MGASSFPTLGFDPCPGDPDGVMTLAGKWQDAAFLLSEVALRLDRTDETQARWKGKSAKAFRNKLNEHRAMIGKFRASYENDAALLIQWAGQLREFQAEANKLETQAAMVDEERRRSALAPLTTPEPAPEASPTPGPVVTQPSHAQLRAQLSDLHTRAQQLHERYLKAARTLGRQVTDLLDLPTGTKGWYGQATDTAQEKMLLKQEASRKGGVAPEDPALRAAWWGSLTLDQQAAMVRDHAGDLGEANGLPADARNAANLVLIQKYRDRAHEKYLRLKSEGSNKAGAAEVRYETLNNLYNSLTNPTDDNYRHPAYLLAIDQVGPGHAIVCYGNPDTARNTAVYVPGTGNNLDHIMGISGNARALFDSSQKTDPGSTASMVYMGYDAPPELYDAAVQSYAGKGAPALAEYVNSLALTHTGPSHVTVIGHSYGSTIVGDALARQHMHADDVIFVGSPGVTVDHASDLHMDPSHVWAGRMQADPVPPISLPLDPLKWGNDYSERFGTDPTSSDFGGQVFAAGFGDSHFGSHSDYWKSSEPSLGNMTHIVTGHPEAVTAPSNAERDGMFPTGVGIGSSNQLVGGVLEDIGHAIPHGYGVPVEHVGDAVNESGHALNAVIGSGHDLITGNLDGAEHQGEDLINDVEGTTSDLGKTITDPFTGW